MMKIDIHNHILPESWPNLKEVSAPISRTLRLWSVYSLYTRSMLWNVVGFNIIAKHSEY